MAFVAGAISVASPCLIPIVPAFAAIVAGLGLAARPEDRSRAALWSYPALFLVGFVGVFVVVGASGTGLGWWVRGALPAMRTVGAIGVLLLALLLLAGPRRLGGERAGRVRVLTALAGVGVGAGISAAWTPCIGPVLATILMEASQPGGSLPGIGLLAIYGSGLSLPFLALGAGAVLLARTVAGLSRPYPVFLSLGVLLALLGILMLSGRFAWLSATLSRYGPFFVLPL